MKKVIAIKNVRYNKVLRVPNTPSAEFEARSVDAKVLEALGKVRYAKSSMAVAVEEVPAPAPAIAAAVTRSMIAQEPRKAGTIEAEGYLRRDMNTENIGNKELSKEEPAIKEVPAVKEVPKGRSKYLKEDVEKELAKERAAKNKGE